LGVNPDTQVYKTNATLCSPSEKVDPKTWKQAIKCCRPRLERELASVPGAPIVAVGGKALQTLTGKAKITPWRGAPVEGIKPFGGRYIIPTIHPAYIMRGKDSWDPVFRMDLSRAISPKPFEWPPFYIDEGPEMEAGLRAILAAKKITAVDVETDDINPFTANLRCIGLANEDVGVSVPWEPPNELYKDLITQILLDPTIEKTFHNAQYDLLSLRHVGGFTVRGPIFDTLLAHAIIAPQLPHDLGFVVSCELNAPRWKSIFRVEGADKGVARFKKADSKDLRTYNCLMGNVSVITRNGPVHISKLVNSKYDGEVLSRSDDGTLEWRRVIGHHKQRSKGQQWIGIKLKSIAENSQLRVTPDHKIGTTRGWVEAQYIQPGDMVFTEEEELSVEARSAIMGTSLGDSTLAISPSQRNRDRKTSAHLTGGHVTSCDLSMVKAAAFPGISHLSEPEEVKSGYTAGTMFQSWSLRSSYQLLEIRNRLGGDKRKITKEILDDLGPIGWAWWFMDDGCLQKGQPGHRDGVTLALCRYDDESRTAVLEWVRNRFGAGSCNGDKVLRLSANPAEKFALWIGEHVTPGTRYKLPRHLSFPPYRQPVFSTGKSYAVPVESVGVLPPPINNTERKRRNLRWCLTVEGNHNFFTSFGLVKNCGDVLGPVLSVPAIKKRLKKLHRGEELSANLHLLSDLAMRMRERGILVDRGSFDEHRRNLTDAMQREREGFDSLGLPAVLGANGMDRSLKKLFFNTFGIKPRTYSKKSGEPELNAETLKILSGHNDLTVRTAASKVLNFRQFGKLLATYIDGIPLDAKDVVHPCWSPHRAVTGRWGCSEPNAQNIPAKMRNILMSRPNSYFVAADFKQLELRIFAVLTGDQRLIDAFNTNAEIHLDRARRIFDDPTINKERDEYKLCKNLTYGILYGAGADKLWRTLLPKFPATPFRMVTRFMKVFFEDHPAAKEWQIEQIRKAEELHFVEDPLSGRREYFHLGRIEPSKVLNFPIQAAAGTLLNRAALAIDKELRWDSGEGLLLAVHDELVTEGPDVERLVEVANRCMTQRVTLNGFTLEFPVDIEVGQNWRDMDTPAKKIAA
jgi:DNA polymerase I-like protein with 3'-5' exonuclease and polymerase domains